MKNLASRYGVGTMRWLSTIRRPAICEAPERPRYTLRDPSVAAKPEPLLMAVSRIAWGCAMMGGAMR